MKERFHNEIIFFIECIHESLDYFVVIKQRLIRQLEVNYFAKLQIILKIIIHGL